jgi:methionyl-tRNA formyltransferase
MIKLGFYLMNEKGYKALQGFLKTFGSNAVAYVISNEDAGLKKDCFYDIKELCLNNKIVFRAKNEDSKNKPKENFKVAIGWRWIIPDWGNLFVFHDSILPKYRGFAPLVNMLKNGEKRIGVTCLKATENYDEGDIFCQEECKINYPIKIENAIKKLVPLYSNILIELYKSLESNNLKFVKQDNFNSSYSPWLDSYDYFINWQWSAEKIKRFVDAVGYPYSGASTFCNNEHFKVIEVTWVQDITIETRLEHLGKVIFFKEGKPVIIAGKGLVCLEKLTDLEGNEKKVRFRSRFWRPSINYE